MTVGTCYISVSTNGRANNFVERYNFEGDRDAVRLGAVGRVCDLEQGLV